LYRSVAELKRRDLVHGGESPRPAAAFPIRINLTQRVSGFGAWNQWQDERAALITTGSQPSVKTVLASKSRLTPEVSEIEFQTITVQGEGPRPASRDFGRLILALLESWDPAAADRIAELHGRRRGATELEVTTAVAVVRAAMQHPLLNPVRAVAVHREYPVSVTLMSGEIVEGIIDLAWSDGQSWTVIDYKTGRAEPQYKTQVQLYALALQKATGLPARAILLEL
jgi:hypothetical protein